MEIGRQIKRISGGRLSLVVLAGLALVGAPVFGAQDEDSKPARIMPRGSSHVQPRTTPSVTPKTTPSISPKTTPSVGYKTTPSISPRRPGDTRVPPIQPAPRPPSTGGGNGHGGHDHDGHHQWTREELRRYLLHRRDHERVILVPSGRWWGIDGYYSNGAYYGYGWPPVDPADAQAWVDWYNRSGYAWDYAGQWADPIAGWQPEYVYANGEPPADESLRPAGRVREEIRREQVQREMERLGWKDGKPPPPPTPYESAIISFRSGKPGSAIPFLREHLKSSAEDSDALRLLAIAQLSSGKVADGVAMMRGAYVLDPTLTSRKVSYTDLGYTSSSFRDVFTRTMTYANNAKTGSAYLAVAVLAQADGRDAVVQQMVEKAVKAGLQREISDAMLASLTPTAKAGSAAPPTRSGVAPAAGAGGGPPAATSPGGAPSAPSNTPATKPEAHRAPPDPKGSV